MSRYSPAKLGLLVTAIVASGFGCELIAQIDRSQITGAGGSGGGTSASSSVTSGSTSASSGGGGKGGAGGSGGAGSTGGAGGGMPCASATECPDPTGECFSTTCTEGKCGQAPKSMGTPGATQTPGDCQVSQCDGAGKLVSVADDNDLPVDASDCTDDVCSAGAPSHPAKPIKTACGLGGALFCDGAGTCVGCNDPTDCAGKDTECQTRTCAGGACGVANAAQGKALAAQTAADCHKDQCDGNGAVEKVVDDSDLPVDSETCTQDLCSGGVASNPAVAVGVACSEGSGILCDGAGKCAACLIATDCAGVDTECQQRSCVAGVCGTVNTAVGTALLAQTASDCKKVVCDGNGGTTTANDDTDLPNDSNVCTTDICTGGVISHANAMNGLSCGGALACLNGACTGCGQASDCPGVDDECKVRTCTAAVCGLSFTASGTAVAAQTAGDCQKKQCDGAGNIASVTDNTDAPADDGNQCTGDVCLAGAPVHPAAAANTVCNQGGGSFCSAVGTCVACNAAAQCPGTDTECHTRTCTANACGANNAAVGTVTSAQATGDCHKNQCDGAGNIVNNVDNTDLPVDDGNQCTGEICTAGAPSHPAAAVNTACNQGGGSFCSAGGACVQCNAAAQCAGTDTECHTRTCTANACGANNAAVGTVTSAQATGDCHKNQCDGAGNIVNGVDNTDLPVDDGNQCTGEICTAGVASHPAAAVDTACNQGGGSFCSAGGACVACNAAAQCAGTDTDCQTRTCSANACGLSFAASGTPTSTQATGDCAENQCNGSGGVVVVTKSTDVPADDGFTCTSETCVGSTPSHPGVPAGTACSQSGGTTCDGAGACVAASCSDGFKNGTETAIDCGGASCPKCALGLGCGGNGDCQSGACAGGFCVQCVTAVQCPGSDTECQVRTCNANVCGVNNTSAGTVTAAQSTGDCHENQCDGAGNIVNNINNSDLPVDDGNQCTGEICTAGAPSHPAAAVNTACNQGGGSFCSAGGACVQCNAATQCAGTDTECHTRTCSGNTCGANDAPFGTLTSAQSPNDCLMNVCDGAGNITTAPDGADLPADDGNQCTGEICTLGVPSHPSAAIDTACNQGGGSFCDGGLSCVQCNLASQCAGADTECHTRTCSAGACGANDAPAGTATSAQTPADCQKNQCDGAGNIISAADNTDVPADDGNQCTGETCTAGAPTHPFTAAGSVCSVGGTACDGAGVCSGPPSVTSTSPADAAGFVLATSTITVNFSAAMNSSTLTVQSSSGACTGSVQVSTDNFATCISFVSASLSASKLALTLTAGPGLSYGSTYKVKVTTAAQGLTNLPCTAYTSTTGFTTLVTQGVVISQVYGGGGNAGSIYTNDFIELHNKGSLPVSLAGWSVQYSSVTGNTWSVTNSTNLTGTIQPGAYYLIQELAGAGGTTSLPLPHDATGTISMSATGGKVVLVSTTTLVTGSCPSGGAVVDFVNYGAGNCPTATPTPAPVLSATTSDSRAGAGCTSTTNNQADFTAGPVNPRNSVTAANDCGAAPTLNESNVALEADFCIDQFPTSVTVNPGVDTGLIYGQLFETGVTSVAGASSWIAQLGYGPDYVNPENQSGWQWFATTFNTQVGNNDEYQGSFTAPASGKYRYTYRFSPDGLNWTYADVNGAGSNASQTFETTQLPILTVN